MIQDHQDPLAKCICRHIIQELAFVQVMLWPFVHTSCAEYDVSIHSTLQAPIWSAGQMTLLRCMKPCFTRQLGTSRRAASA